MSDLAYDSARDEVVLAVRDCFAEDGEYSTTYSDCHYELRSYPRSGGTAYTLIELPEEITALDYDARTSMLMVSGQTNVMFFDRSRAGGSPVLADGGLDETGGEASAAEPAYQLPLVGAFQFCY